MAWTAPRTWVTAEVVSASNMNTHVRDNFLETAPAKAGVGLVVGTAANVINVRDPQYQRINTSETTTSTSFTDLATSGPAATTTTGTEAFVMWGASAVNDTATSDAVMGVAVTGASTIAATNNYIFVVSGTERVQAGMGILLSGLTAGSNTFTAKYRVEANTGTFGVRFIIVMPVR